MATDDNTRSASHAGSWYTDDGDKLSKQLQGWLKIPQITAQDVRGVISPHAGYSYSGPSAGHAFKHLANVKTSIKRVFILGPSHHVYISGCALSKMHYYETPQGNLKVDREMIDKLYSTKQFEWMSKEVDEDEHSLEMQLPYIFEALGERANDVPVVPIMVGATSKDQESAFGKLLSEYVTDPKNFFVISSDFCHWGSRFSFTHYDESKGQIFQSIESLDRMGMDCIEARSTDQWYSYLKKYKNTICGQHPIGVFLNMLDHAKSDLKIKFVFYAQSSQVTKKNDSSVSYAPAITFKQ